MTEWMIYGANGYTGELIAREASARGMRPILAGRNGDKVEPMARELGLPFRLFPLSRPDLSGVGLVLHCAGPFAQTSGPMVEACLRNRAHYLDITGEIAVFEAVFARDAEARASGVTLLPGVGFDVVPTDCVAAMLSGQLPDADQLWLAFAPSRGSSASRGTLKTMIEGAGSGGAIRQEGRIVRVPVVYEVREIPFPDGPRQAMTIPWGDVSTAFRTTGIPNIRVYAATSPKAVARARRLSRISPLIAWKPVNNLLKRIAARVAGPTATMRASGRVAIWGRVANRSGEERSMALSTPEGYAFTVDSALAAVERVLVDGLAPGATTPALAFGAEFVLSIPGVRSDDFPRARPGAGFLGSA